MRSCIKLPQYEFPTLSKGAADTTNERTEGLLELIPAGKKRQTYPFQVLFTGKQDTHKPLIFIDQAVAVINVPEPGE